VEIAVNDKSVIWLCLLLSFHVLIDSGVVDYIVV
jgi:hypothetical protein